MANPYIIGVGALAIYGYATGRISNFIDNYKNRNNDSSSPSLSKQAMQQQQQQQIPTQQPIIIQSSNDNKKNSYLIPFGCACLVGLSGYYYFINSSGTKKVIGAVEETAEETQNLIQQTDDNNSKRFQILDSKNESRAQNLEIQIRSEQRAGFNVISEQIYCLQQVAIQTLHAVASSINNNNNNNNGHHRHDKHGESDNITNEKLLGYCDKAQEMADTILSEQHTLKIKENNLKDIKAEIQLRNVNNNNNNNNNNNINQYDIISNQNDITPGGPINDDNNNHNHNPFDLNQNQSTVITNVSSSYKHNIKSKKHEDEEENDNMISRMIQKLQNGIKPFEIGYHIWNKKKEYIVIGTGTIFTFYICKKATDYFSNKNSNNSNNTKIIQY